MYAMDMRQYDPAIARWVVQDPVVHHSMSPYNAFDNNPVYWADPSGADATSYINFLWNITPQGTSAQYGDNNSNDSNDDELHENFSIDGYNTFIFKNTIGDVAKIGMGILSILDSNDKYSRIADDNDRLTKILLFKKDIKFEYFDIKGNKINKSDYDKLKANSLPVSLKKTTIVKRYQGRVPTIASNGVISTKDIILSLKTNIQVQTTSTASSGKTISNKSINNISSKVGLDKLSSNLQLIFQKSYDFNQKQFDNQIGTFEEVLQEGGKKIAE